MFCGEGALYPRDCVVGTDPAINEGWAYLTLRSLADDYDDAELIERYAAIRGIGRWTVEMLLLFHLGRPDVMPIHDLGVRKGYAITYEREELPKPKQLERECELWRPYRSVGSWYMWRATEL